MKLGTCSITRAEIWGILEGMRFSWNRGIRYLAIQIDSICVVHILSNTHNTDHQRAGLMKMFMEMIGRN
ncbi:hypothetical protein LINPERHAP2_LOCUS29894 [Linum perenne]